MIVVDKVTKRYPNGAVALRGVSLRIPAGSVVVLAGRSGAGKTTLLKLICGEETPTEGSVRVDGLDLSKLSARKLAGLRRRMGISFQEPQLHPRMRVGRIVARALKEKGVGLLERRRRAYLMLRDLGLVQQIRAKPKHLSSGEQRRVDLARALVAEREFIIVDEPTGNLDSDSTRRIVRLLIDANRAGATIVLATHQWDVIETLHHRTLVLDAGQIVFEPTGTMGMEEQLPPEIDEPRPEAWNPRVLGRSVVRFLEEMREREQRGEFPAMLRTVTDELPGLPPRERALPRVGLRTEATLTVEGRRIECLTRNISCSGLCLFGVSRSLVDRRVGLSFTLPGSSEVLASDAIVVRQALQGSVREWGIQFRDPDPAAIAAIAGFVAANSDGRAASRPAQRANSVATRTAKGRKVATVGADENLLPLYREALRSTRS